MTRPKCYDPQQGYKYQFTIKFGNEPYEHLDYAVDCKDKKDLTDNYNQVYKNQNVTIKIVTLPMKYWRGK